MKNTFNYLVICKIYIPPDSWLTLKMFLSTKKENDEYRKKNSVNVKEIVLALGARVDHNKRTRFTRYGITENIWTDSAGVEWGLSADSPFSNVSRDLILVKSLLEGVEGVDSSLVLGRRSPSLEFQFSGVHHGPQDRQWLGTDVLAAVLEPSTQ